MTLKKIIAIHLDLAQQVFYIGSSFNYDTNNKITEIKDTSREYPDHTEYVFQIYAGDKLLHEIINCPVRITYDNIIEGENNK